MTTIIILAIIGLVIGIRLADKWEDVAAIPIATFFGALMGFFISTLIMTCVCNKDFVKVAEYKLVPFPDGEISKTKQIKEETYYRFRYKTEKGINSKIIPGHNVYIKKGKPARLIVWQYQFIPNNKEKPWVAPDWMFFRYAGETNIIVYE